MHRLFRRYLPPHEAISNHRWLAPFQTTLLHPRLWHLNRRSAAGGVAVGLFCGLIPGPFQMLGAAIAVLVLRVNLPVALACTLYTNPLTIVPLYVIAYELGQVFFPAHAEFVPPPDLELGNLADLSAWLGELLAWGVALGKPLVVGLILLASLLAALGYGVVRVVWRFYLVKHWRARRLRPGQSHE
jgi:uncharacterized protein (DUF2062 family)